MSGYTSEKGARRSEEWLRALQQLFTSWERATVKKAIFQDVLNYLKWLHQTPGVSQSLEGTM